jgi:glycine dehydrogenase
VAVFGGDFAFSDIADTADELPPELIRRKPLLGTGVSSVRTETELLRYHAPAFRCDLALDRTTIPLGRTMKLNATAEMMLSWPILRPASFCTARTGKRLCS